MVELDEGSTLLLEEAARAGLKTSEIELTTDNVEAIFGRIETEFRGFAVRGGLIYEESPIYSKRTGHLLNGYAAETVMSRSATRVALGMIDVPVANGRALRSSVLDAVFAYARNIQSPLLIAPDDRELGSAWLCVDTAGSFENVVGMLATICDTISIESIPTGRTFRFFFTVEQVIGVKEVLDPQIPLTGESPEHIPNRSVFFAGKCEPHPSYFREASRVLGAFPTLKYGAVDIRLLSPDEPANSFNFQVSAVHPRVDFGQTCWTADGQEIKFSAALVRMLADMQPEGMTDPTLAKRDRGVERYDMDVLDLILASRELGMNTRMVNSDSAGGSRRTLQIEVASTPVQFRNGAIRIVDQNGNTSHINDDAVKITVNKQATREILETVGLSGPEGRQFASSQLAEALIYADDLGYPICVKPLSGSRGRLVSTGLTTSAEVAKAFREVASAFGEVIVERNVDGEVVRLFYMKPDICTAQYQARPAVIGDGKSSVISLIEQRNTNRGTSQRKPAIVTRAMVGNLAHRGIDLADCLPTGEKLIFGATSHISLGARAAVASDIHPSYLENARKAFKAIDGLTVGAMDMIVKNPRQPATSKNHWILEVNSSANIVAFHQFKENANLDGCKALLRHVERVLTERNNAETDAQTNSIENPTENISRALEHMERASPVKVANTQAKQLEQVLHHAWQHTGFYRSRLNCLFEGGGFNPEAWTDVPLLTRQEAQEHRLSRRAFELRDGNQTYASRTSGSSGVPLDITWNLVATVSTRAAAERMYRWHGLDLDAPLAEIKSFGGVGYDFPGGRGPQGWSPSSPNATRFRLSVSTPVKDQLAWLALVKAPYLTTYPTMIRELALEALKHKSTLRFDAILTIGEVLTPEIRQLCNEAFGARVIDSYGCQEIGKLAIQCDQSENYHVCLSNVLFEVLDENGRHVAPGESGRVILTSLFNYATPFIRYDIGDYAQLGMGPCQCGRSLPVLTSIVGRRRNMVTLPDGEKRWLSGTVLAELGSMVHAEQSRLIQRTHNLFELQFVANGNSIDFDPKTVARRATELIHPEIILEPIRVDALKRSSGGKFEDVVGLEQEKL
ncbi:hypothetical protein [Pararhizobium sp. IMCC21322]|uniref:ATP-binding protein n=1 Tax=Pararhizobium sp. IMCC21322 TaxID=3067903 RepID=UPI0027424DC5|nr:hypothetical protein [Pararhizobium sp. IMCC21322]